MACTELRHEQRYDSDWRPLQELERTLGLAEGELCSQFMWMHAVVDDQNRTTHAYKHRITRRYVHLSEP